MPAQKFPVTLVHDDLPGREIVAHTRTSLRAHGQRGWKPKPAKKAPSTTATKKASTSKGSNKS